MSLQLITGNGEFADLNELNHYFANNLKSEYQMKHISIFGAQSSGKSTLLNDMFNTHLDVQQSNTVNKRTTTGIMLTITQQSSQNVLILDCEGTDSSERLLNNEMHVEEKIGVFACVVSDILLINLWHSDLGRFQASNYHVINQIFDSFFKRLRSQRQQLKERVQFQFVVRDSVLASPQQKTDTEQKIIDDIERIYAIQEQKEPFSTYFEVKIAFLAHRVYDFQKYQQNVSELRDQLLAVKNTVQISSQLLPEYLQKIWLPIKSTQELNIFQQRELIVQQKLQLTIEENANKFEQYLQAIQKKVDQFALNGNQKSLNSAASFSMSVKQVVNQYKLQQFVVFIKTSEIYDGVVEKYDQCFKEFEQEVIQITTHKNYEIHAKQLKTQLDMHLTDFKRDQINFVGKVYQESYIQIKSDMADHFQSFFDTQLPCAFPMNIFNPISACQVFANQTFILINQLLGLQPGRMAEIYSNIEKVEQIQSPGGKLQKQISVTQLEDLQDASEELSCIANTMKNLNLLKITMNPSQVSFESQSITKSLGQVAEALLCGYIYYMKTLFGIGLKDNVMNNSIFELIQLMNQETEALVHDIQLAITKQRQQQYQQSIQQKIEQLQLQNHKTQLQALRDQTVVEESDNINLLFEKILGYHFKPELNQNILFTCHMPGQPFEEYMNLFIRKPLTPSNKLSSPSIISQSQLTVTEQFSYCIQNQMKNMMKTQFDEIFIQQANSVIIAKDFKQDAENLYKQLMNTHLESKFKNQFTSEKQRQTISLQTINTVIDMMQSVGGSLLSTQDLQNVTLQQLKMDTSSIQQFEQAARTTFQVKQPIDKKLIVGAAFLARNDIKAIISSKKNFTIALMLILILAYLHNAKDLSQFFSLVNEFFQLIQESFQKKDWAALQQQGKEFDQKIRRWWKK
ncbi:Guanylate_binding protein [Hexamita inflata]|uniref:Guanylate binding protein n=1 Tax=Hexamita inflata TaxID=28002 RepID=A0AA86V1P7_9EUKA|nr:Guanylate binding protein [Hexamita inflata]